MNPINQSRSPSQKGGWKDGRKTNEWSVGRCWVNPSKVPFQPSSSWIDLYPLWLEAFEPLVQWFPATRSHIGQRKDLQPWKGDLVFLGERHGWEETLENEKERERRKGTSRERMEERREYEGNQREGKKIQALGKRGINALGSWEWMR